MNDQLLKIFHHAANDLTRELREMQHQILLRDKFGDNAVMHVEFFSPEDKKRSARLWADLDSRHAEKLELVTRLKQLIASIQDNQFNADVDSFIKTFQSYKKQK